MFTYLRGFIPEILMHVNLNMSYEDLKDNSYNLVMRKMSVMDGVKMSVELQAAVFIKDIVSIADVYTGVVAGLAEHNLRAKWSDVPYKTILTPTPFHPMSADEIGMAMFDDSTILPHACPVLYAMADIQACEGVKIQEFHQMEGNVIQAGGGTCA